MQHLALRRRDVDRGKPGCGVGIERRDERRIEREQPGLDIGVDLCAGCHQPCLTKLVTGRVWAFSSNPAISGRPFAIAACTAGSWSDAL